MLAKLMQDGGWFCSAFLLLLYTMMRGLVFITLYTVGVLVEVARAEHGATGNASI